ncbi:MAG TPA: hypothetical protein VH280_12905 [Verrucomicrobiae bacterium]|jgi:hypothetical protein|nr:hypothetical protein [Verrucomicrobiae bacterium]
MRLNLSFAAVIGILTAAAAVSADPPADPAKIGALDAPKFYGREMIVTGTVAQVTIRPNIVFLNMDKPYPRSPFSLVIFPAATNQFGDLKALKGTSVQATGKIIDYHNKPEIVLDKASQLTVTSAGK